MTKEWLDDVAGKALAAARLNAAAEWLRANKGRSDLVIRFGDVDVAVHTVNSGEFVAAVEQAAMVYERMLIDAVNRRASV